MINKVLGSVLFLSTEPTFANTLNVTGKDPLSNYFWGVVFSFLLFNYVVDFKIGRLKKFVIGNLFLFSKDRSKPDTITASIAVYINKLKFEIFGQAIFLGICYGIFRYKTFTTLDQAVEYGVLALEFAYPTYVLLKLFFVEDCCPHCGSIHSNSEIGREFTEYETTHHTNKKGIAYSKSSGEETIEFECKSCGFNWTEEFDTSKYERNNSTKQSLD